MKPTDKYTNLDALRLWHRVLLGTLKEIPYDLSGRQMALLMTVYLKPQPHTIRSLSEALGISKPAVCRGIDMLGRLNLVKRVRDQEDRRNVYVQRTVKGSVLLSEFADIILQQMTPRQTLQPA